MLRPGSVIPLGVARRASHGDALERMYVQSGLAGSVYAFAIGGGGALTHVQVASVPDGGSQEGIAIG